MNSLQDVLESVPDAVEHFFNDTRPKNFRLSPAGAALFPPEYTNWRDEQQAWRDTAVIFDQSYNMPELYVSGPDSIKLLSTVAVNNLGNWTVDRAKQIVACAPNGFMIGDCIGYRLGENEFELVSGSPMLSWVAYQAEIGGFDVELRSDPLNFDNASVKRIRYRYQILGPATAKILDEVIEGGLPEIPFFRTATVRIAGHDVLALRHGMAGSIGAELSGPFGELEPVRDALLAAGVAHDLRRGGSRAYFSTLFESGWMSYPLPAIYTDPELRGYREWLPSNGYEANVAPGGSFRVASLADYYTTPWELGYGHIINFEHDFIGRDALLRSRDQPRRHKMTLVWNVEDVTRVMASDFRVGPHFKSIDPPVAYYGSPHADEVRALDGTLVGISSHCGLSSNVGQMLSLALLEEKSAVPGTEVVLTWGEPGGGSRKPRVEAHEQTTIRAIVAPAPYPQTSGDSKNVDLR